MPNYKPKSHFKQFTLGNQTISIPLEAHVKTLFYPNFSATQVKSFLDIETGSAYNLNKPTNTFRVLGFRLVLKAGAVTDAAIFSIGNTINVVGTTLITIYTTSTTTTETIEEFLYEIIQNKNYLHFQTSATSIQVLYAFGYEYITATGVPV